MNLSPTVFTTNKIRRFNTSLNNTSLSVIWKGKDTSRVRETTKEERRSERIGKRKDVTYLSKKGERKGPVKLRMRREWI